MQREFININNENNVFNFLYYVYKYRLFNGVLGIIFTVQMSFNDSF